MKSTFNIILQRLIRRGACPDIPVSPEGASCGVIPGTQQQEIREHRGTGMERKMLSPATFVGILSILLVGIFAGCGSIPPMHLYTIDSTLNSANKDGGTVHFPIPVSVREFEAGLLYQDQRILYRESPYEIKYWNYHQWIAPPAEMATYLFKLYLQENRMFASVSDYPSPLRTKFVFHGQLLAFEEWDEADAWYAKVGLKLMLSDFDAKRVVWEKTVEKTERIPTRLPASVVQGISRALHACLEESIADLQGQGSLELSRNK